MIDITGQEARVSLISRVRKQESGARVSLISRVRSKSQRDIKDQEEESA